MEAEGNDGRKGRGGGEEEVEAGKGNEAKDEEGEIECMMEENISLVRARRRKYQKKREEWRE